MRKKVAGVVLLLVMGGCVSRAPGGWPGLGRDGLLVGTAVRQYALVLDRGYRESLLSRFSVIVPENEMKFDAISPELDRYEFGAADDIVNFSERHGLRLHGHTLVWHRQLPAWFSKGNFDRATVARILKTHISKMVTRYKGRVESWDVVNEALNSDGSLRRSIWSTALGVGYIETALREAHNADPEAKLYYNDFGIAMPGPKLKALLEMLADFKKRGVPIDGVGIQLHLRADSNLPPEKLLVVIQQLGQLGLLVRLSEVEVRVKSPPSPEDLENQARLYQSVFKVCKEALACTQIVLWGFTDRYSWVPQAFPGFGSANILDETFRQKFVIAQKVGAKPSIEQPPPAVAR